MRCTDMLEKVARDNSKIARLVAGESAWLLEEIVAEFKTFELYYEQTDKNAKNTKLAEYRLAWRYEQKVVFSFLYRKCCSFPSSGNFKKW